MSLQGRTCSVFWQAITPPSAPHLDFETLRVARPCAQSRSTVHTPGHPLDQHLVSPCPEHNQSTLTAFQF